MHQPASNNTKNLRLAFFINLAFTVLELFGGLYTNSLAILSDAFHDFGDSVSLGLAWYFQHLSVRGRDHNFTYGYRRFSLLGALVNSLILTAGSIFIIVEAIPRLQAPEVTMSEGMAALAVIGIIVNYLAMRVLQRGHSLNERVVSLHLFEDVLGWVAVLVGAIVIYFTDWYIIDPLLSLLIAGIILFNVIRNLKEAIDIILQKVPKDIDVDLLTDELSEIKSVLDVFDLHVWTLDGERIILSVHLVVAPGLNREDLIEIKNRARERVRAHGIGHSTIEINLPEEEYTDEPDR